MRSSSRLRTPLRNSTRELRKWLRVLSLTRLSSIGIAVSQRKQPPACAWVPVAAVFSSILGLLHFDGQYLILQLCAPGRKARHRGRQADVTAQGADLDHQFVALLEQADLAFGGKGELQAHLVAAVGGLREGVRPVSY